LLAPLIVAAIETSGVVRAVVLAPNLAAGDLRLETDVLRLQQQFGASPSEVRFTLRATLLDPASRRVLATREFDLSVPAPSEDARGGVVAANRAVREVLQQLAAFVADTATDWQPPEGGERREVRLPAR
jgi:cholesterol transport system auxiliary component